MFIATPVRRPAPVRSARRPLAIRSLLLTLSLAVGLEAGACTGTVSGATDAAPSTPDAQSLAQEGQPCDAQQLCADPLLCIADVCTVPGAACDDDDDCEGDTFCCSDDCLPPGHSGGVCVDYGTGGHTTNPVCKGEVVIGLFQADTQCEWTGPPPGDPYPGHVQVLTTALVADLPHDSGASAEIVVVSYNYTDGGAPAGRGSDPDYYGVIRVLSGKDCSQLENIDDPENRIIAATPPAIGDLDGDGTPEIVTHRAGSELIAFAWDDVAHRYRRLWVSTGSDIGDQNRWDGPALHDLDNDGRPEVISGGEVFDGTTGARLNAGQSVGGAMRLSIVGDVDADGVVEFVGADVYRWNVDQSRWALVYEGVPDGKHFAYADFGTPGATPAEFDPTQFDGISEIVATGDDVAYIATLAGDVVLSVTSGMWGGGPPTVGDFDNDGRPEFAAAGGDFYRVFDLDCSDGPNAECADEFIRWRQPSQDHSSRMTGSSIFDFEGDGQAEAVYADECFTRIYEGTTGRVLYSAFRTSCTWYENPVIADPDRDQNTEIVVGSNANCGLSCPEIDPIHIGVACEDDEDCGAGWCDAGYCRCVGDDECDPGYVCRTSPVDIGGTGKTCRAYHPPGVGMTGLRVLRDRYDRWASSRPLWNQHAYSVTNVNDDLTVPRTSDWTQNFLVPTLNNYRQNIQGDVGAEDRPDITGRLTDEMACLHRDGATLLVADVCNRGQRAVGSSLPATFYAGSVAPENVLCTSYTDEPVPVGECREIQCEISADVEGEIILVVNDDGAGGKATLECFEDNNADRTTIALCAVVD